MSRNLGQITCNFCGSRVGLDESPREITLADAGAYFPEYRGMLVANATCAECGSRYLAWMRGAPLMSSYWSEKRDESGFLHILDLSFRSSFNDEPGPDDYPLYQFEMRLTKVGPWPTCEACGKPLSGAYEGASCSDYCFLRPHPLKPDTCALVHGTAGLSCKESILDGATRMRTPSGLRCNVGVVRDGRGESCGACATVVCVAASARPDVAPFCWYACGDDEHRRVFYQCDGKHLIAVKHFTLAEWFEGEAYR